MSASIPTPPVSQRPTAAGILLAGVLAIISSCRGQPSAATGESAELNALRSEVQALRDSLSALVTETAFSAGPGEAATGPDVLIAIHTELVQELVGRTSEEYLSDVQLHLEPEALVDVGDEVRIKLGLFKVYAGKWNLKANIQRVRTSLSVSNIALTPADSNRFQMIVPVAVGEGEGEAVIDFKWDSATMATAVCRDFEVHDSFSGVVEPRTYEMPARVRLVASPTGVAATPEFTEQIEIRPEPTAESWDKVRQLLERQNSIFKCGFAIQPDAMEGMLRDLLRKGFSFRLPESILKPIPLPANISEDVRVGEKRITVEARPSLLELTEDWLWYGTDVTARRRT